MAFIDIDVTKNIKTIDCWMQGEKNAEGVHFDISTWIETYGAGTAYIYIRRNGDETAYFRAMEVTDEVAEWLFSAADTAKAGDGRAQAVYITTDESVVKKTNWYHTVTAESEGDPTGEDPDPYKEMATEVIARMEEAEEELTEEALGEISDAKDAALEDIQDTMFNLAPEFVTTASYSAGDIVLYIGNLYEFTADHAAGAWIGTDARQTTIGGVVADLKEELEDNTGQTVISFSTGFIRTNGTTVDITSVDPNPGFRYAVVDCVEGDQFIINGQGASGGRLWCFIDNNTPATPLLRALSSAIGNDLVITAPANSAKLVINRDLSITKDCYKGNYLVNVINENKLAIASVINADWIKKGISSETGAVIGANNRICDETFYPINEINSIQINSNAKATIRYYSDCYYQYYMGSGSWETGTIKPAYGGAKYFRIVAGYSDDRDVTNVLDLGNMVVMYSNSQITKLPVKMEIGNYSTGNGGQIPNAAVARAVGMYQNDNKLYINIPSIYTYGVRYFDANKKMVRSTGWLTGSGIIITRAEARYVYFSVKKSDGSDMTETDLKTIENNISVLYIGQFKNENKYRVELTSPVLIQNIDDNLPDSLTLCSVKFKNEQNKHPVPVGYLFRNNKDPFVFYWSSDGKTVKELFRWNKSVTDTGSRSPHEYAIDVTYEGDIICVYHGDMAYNQGITPYRQNPIVYPHNDYEHPVMVDFGNDPAPTAWLQNTGVHVESGNVYIAEYTRFGHAYSYVWKVTSPYTAKANWSIIKSFQVSGNQQGFKHCHNIDRDPYSGILYLTTGDVPPTDPQYVGTPGIYYSTDNGASWTTLLEGSEKYCRQLNFIWTEDYIYWASDTSDAYEHWFIRAKRNNNGVIDINSIEDLFMFITGAATYNICYCETPKGILCLDRYDGVGVQPLNVHFWNIDKEKLYIIDIIKPMGSGFTGFRVEAMSHYPSANEAGFLCGFGCCQNNNKMTGNKYSGAQNSTGYAPSASDNIGLLNNVLVKIVPN